MRHSNQIAVDTSKLKPSQSTEKESSWAVETIRGVKRSNTDEENGEDDATDESIFQKNKIRKVEKEAQNRICEKIKEIVNREFSISLKEKEADLENIDNTILKIQKALHLVRYGAVANYFARSIDKQTNSQPENVSIHPAIRKLTGGKKPSETSKPSSPISSSSRDSLSFKVSKSESTSKASSIISDSNETSLRTDGELDSSTNSNNIIPGYFPPKPAENAPKLLDPRNAKHKLKRRFVIGNVSKWIQCDQREDLSTHKWMIYVRGDKDNPDVSNVVSKVRFLIHPSYHPHDIIEVDKWPFHLTRRGWGEFPARIQIHFKDFRDKPVDIIHHLKLDRTYTGLQTLGSETVVDIWLHQPREPKIKKPSSPPINEEFKEGGWVIPHDDKEPDSLFDSLLSSSFIDNPLENINFEHSNTSSIGDITSIKEVEDNELFKTTYIRCTDPQGVPYYLPVTMMPNNYDKQVTPKINNHSLKPLRTPPLASRARNTKLNKSNDLSKKVTTCSNNDLNFKKTPTKNLLKKDAKSLTSSTEKSPSTAKASSSMSGKLRNKSSLLKPGISLLKKNNIEKIVSTTQKSDTKHLTELEKVCSGISISLWTHILGRNTNDSQLDIEYRILKKGAASVKRHVEYISFLKDKLSHLSKTNFSDSDTCILYIARFFPIISPQATDPIFKTVHPYAANSLKKFKSWNMGKQLASEWMRASTIRRVIKSFPALNGLAKPTNYIVQFLKEHGFSVPFQVSQEIHISNSDSSTIWSSKSISLTEDFINNWNDLEKSVQKLKSKEENKIIDIITLDDDDAKDVDSTKEDLKKKSLKLSTKQKSTSKSKSKKNNDNSKQCLMLPEDKCDLFQFMTDISSAVGVKLNESEELSPGIVYPATQKILYRACKNFCELLIRKSHQTAFKRLNGQDPNELSLNDVALTLENEPRFQMFTNYGLGKLMKTE